MVLVYTTEFGSIAVGGLFQTYSEGYLISLNCENCCQGLVGARPPREGIVVDSRIERDHIYMKT